MSNELNVECEGTTLIVRFTRPEIRNPLSVSVLDQLELILDGIADRSDIKTVLFTGSGTSFASGADLREIAHVTPDSAPAFARKGQQLMERIASMGQKTIAAINGYCFGGALDLALACDVRIACSEAKFAHPGTGLGIITGWGGTQRLPRLIGTSNSLEMFFTAEAINADRAIQIGLVDAISDDTLETALNVAD